MSAFDDMAANDVPMFFDQFGDTATYTSAVSGVMRNISVILLDAKPILMTEASDDLECQQVRIKVSARSNSEGVISPAIGGFKGQAADRVTNLLTAYATTWYVVDRLEDSDTGFHTLILRDKQFLKGTL